MNPARWRRVVNTTQSTVYEWDAFQIHGTARVYGNSIRRDWTIYEKGVRLDYFPARLAEAKRDVEQIIKLREGTK